MRRPSLQKRLYTRHMPKRRVLLLPTKPGLNLRLNHPRHRRPMHPPHLIGRTDGINNGKNRHRLPPRRD